MRKLPGPWLQVRLDSQTETSVEPEVLGKVRPLPLGTFSPGTRPAQDSHPTLGVGDGRKSENCVSGDTPFSPFRVGCTEPPSLGVPRGWQPRLKNPTPQEEGLEPEKEGRRGAAEQLSQGQIC